MKSKIFFISEALSAPFDEGLKNVAFSIYTQLNKKSDVLTVTNMENEIDKDNILKFRLNRLFLNYKLRMCIRKFYPHIILYFPESSITIASFIRAKILKIMGRPSGLAILGSQYRKYSPVQKYILRNLLKPDLLLLLGKSDENYFKKNGFNVKILPPAVDTEKYSPSTKEEKMKIRSRFNISSEKFVVLHVGHIKVKRNIECLIEVHKIHNAQVVMVGSTSLGMEEDVKKKLIENGIIVIDKYVPDIWNIYKMSDLYIFPVKSETEAIEMPLSVLEAMACNLPVITTKFRGLREHFQEDEGFRYFNDEKKLPDIARKMRGVIVANNKKMERFTWDAFCDEIIIACKELL